MSVDDKLKKQLKDVKKPVKTEFQLSEEVKITIRRGELCVVEDKADRTRIIAMMTNPDDLADFIRSAMVTL